MVLTLKKSDYEDYISCYSFIQPSLPKEISQSQVEDIKQNLVIETHTHTDNSNVTETIFRPKESVVDHFRVIRTELSQAKSNKTRVLYHCKLWSFSKEDIVKMITDNETK